MYYPPVLGGAESYVWNLATSMVRAGHEVEVHTSSSAGGQNIARELMPSFELREGVKIYRTKLYYGLQFFPKHHDDDIVHLNSFGPPYFFIESIRNSRRGLVSTPIGEEMIAWKKWRVRALAGPTLRLSRRVVALSNLERVFLLENCGLRPDSVAHIPLGVSESAFELPSPAHLESVRSSITDSDYFVSVARVVSSKNLEVGVRALASMPRSIHYVIVGPISDPSVYSDCVRLAERLAVRDRLHFAGALPGPILRAAVRLSEASLITGAEPYSIAALEAMAQGRPVVAPMWYSLGEIVRDGVTGLLYRYGDSETAALALRRLTEDENLAEKLGESGREIAAKEHDWNRVSRQTLELYESALSA